MGARRQMAVMAWMSDLGGMMRSGTVIRASCQAPACRHWEDLALADLLADLGSPKATLWDRHPPCSRCAEPVLLLASPGPGGVFRPLISQGIPAEGLPIASQMDGWFGLRG